MSRALSAGELTKIRTDGQRSQLYLAFVTRSFQDSWLTGNVTTPPTLHDGAHELGYTLAGGDYTNVKPNMTVYFYTGMGGSGTLVGRGRVRKAPTSDTLYFGETSEIQWASVVSFQVIGDFKLWQRHVRVENDVVYMDYDVSYTDQHTDTEPVPVMGPPVVIMLDADLTPVDVQFDGSDSWSPDGSAITSYLWECPYADNIDDPTSATPTMTFSWGWNFDVWLTVTTAAGKSYTGWRPVVIFEPGYYEPYRDFSLDSCVGDVQSGGWNFRATLYNADANDEHGLADLEGGDMVILFSRDFYGDVEAEIGALSGRGNIVAVGYLNGESIERDALVGSMMFEVQGPQWVLGNMTGFAAGVEDTDQGDLGGGAATAWTNFENLTPKKAAWHWAHWRTTLTACHDVLIDNDPEGRQVPALSVGEGTLLDQLRALTEHTILARPVFDRCGRLFVQVMAQALTISQRNSIPVVMDLLKQDWRNPQSISRQPFNLVGRVDVSGISYLNGTSTPLCGRANGNVPDWHGKVQRFDRLVFADAGQMLELAAALWGMLNNPYPSALVRLAGTQHVVDVAPLMYFRQDIAADDTIRGVVWSQMRMQPRRVSHSWSAENGVFSTEVDFEPEAGFGQSVQTSCGGLGLPEFGTWTPPGLPPWVIIPPIEGQFFRSVMKLGSSGTPVAFHDCISQNSAAGMSATPITENAGVGPVLTSHNYTVRVDGYLVGSEFVLEAYWRRLAQRVPEPPIAPKDIVIPGWGGGSHPDWNFGMVDERYLIVNVPENSERGKLLAVDIWSGKVSTLRSYTTDDTLCQTVGLVTAQYQGKYYTVWITFGRDILGGNFSKVSFYVYDHARRVDSKVDYTLPGKPNQLFNYSNPVVWKNKVAYFLTGENTDDGDSWIFAFTFDFIERKVKLDVESNFTDRLQCDIAALDYTFGFAIFDASQYGAVPHYVIKKLNLRTGHIDGTVSSSTLGFIDCLSDSKHAYTHRGGAVIRVYDNTLVANLGTRAYDYQNGLCPTLDDANGYVWCLANDEIRGYNIDGLQRTITLDPAIMPSPSDFSLTDWVRQSLSLQGNRFLLTYSPSGADDIAVVVYDV